MKSMYSRFCHNIVTIRIAVKISLSPAFSIGSEFLILLHGTFFLLQKWHSLSRSSVCLIHVLLYLCLVYFTVLAIKESLCILDSSATLVTCISISSSILFHNLPYCIHLVWPITWSLSHEGFPGNTSGCKHDTLYLFIQKMYVFCLIK